MIDQTDRDTASVRLALDAQSERQTASLRVVAALLALVAGCWLFALPYPLLYVFALASLAFAAIFLASAARMRKRSLHAQEHYLDLGPDALRVREGDRVQIVPWREVKSVRIDEDRLVVWVDRGTGPALELEPRYRGLSLHALAAAVHGAFSAAQKRGGCAPAIDG
jgi:hypothetical protein